MTGVTLAAAVGCVVISADARIDATATGWEGRSAWEIGTASRCPYVDVRVGPGVVIDGRRVRLSLLVGNGKHPGADHWEVRDAGVDGAALRLHLPEVLGGDRAWVRLDWHDPAGGPLTWVPDAAVSTLRVDPGLAVDSTGVARSRDGWFASSPKPDAKAVFSHPTAPGRPSIAAARVLATSDHLTLDVIGPDPLATLYPGGGSRVRVDRTVTLEAAPHPTALTWSLPPRASVTVPDGWTATAWAAGVTVTVPPATVEGTVTWTTPDAPACGTGDVTVDAPDGEIVWDTPLAWRLATWRGRPVSPDRDGLVRALDRRFAGASLREPGLPAALERAGPGWDRVAPVLALLHERTSPARWPAWPDWPRPILEARNSGAVTPIEGALLVVSMLRRVEMDARWVLVRPAALGDTAAACPVAYPEALVAVTFDGETRFVDPGCPSCAPFEVRPGLRDASALGVDRTPPGDPGRFAVTRAGDTVTWELDGAPALLLRAWLADVPPKARLQALAERVAGEGATLAEVDGITTAGAAIVLVATGPGGEDPLGLGTPDADGAIWARWTGERRLVTPATGRYDDVLETPELSWSRTTEDGVTTEVLRIDVRRVGDVARHSLTERRSQRIEEPR